MFRTLALRAAGGGRERHLHHLQFIRWPDQGVPESTAGIMDLIYALGRSNVSTQTPIVVHCSGGVGRTGTFIAMHVALSLFQLEQPISVPRIVQFLKYCRSGMVQRKDQYLFAYYAILKEIERLVWEAHAGTNTRHRLAAMAAANNRSASAVVEQRQSEYVPRHPAQFRPGLEKSSLRAPIDYDRDDRFSAGGAPPPVVFQSRGGVNSPLRGQTAATTSSNRNQGIVYVPAIPSSSQSLAGGSAAWAAATDLESEVRRLQQANQQVRQTPVVSRGRVFAPPNIQPLTFLPGEDPADYQQQPAARRGGLTRNTEIIDATNMFAPPHATSAPAAGAGNDASAIRPVAGYESEDRRGQPVGLDFAPSPRAQSPPRPTTRADGYPAPPPPSTAQPPSAAAGRQLDFHSSPMAYGGGGNRGASYATATESVSSAAPSVGAGAGAPGLFFDRYSSANAEASPRPVPVATSRPLASSTSYPTQHRQAEPSSAHPASPTQAMGSDLARAAGDFNSMMFAGGSQHQSANSAPARRGDINLL